MKKLTREQLQSDATRLMKAHNATEIFATADGNFFFKAHDAGNHNGTLNKPGETAECKVEKFSTDAVETPVLSEKEKAVIACRLAVTKAEAKLSAAADNKKEAAQKALDKVTVLLKEAEKALEEEKAAPETEEQK